MWGGNVYNANSGYTRSDHAQDRASQYGRPVGSAYQDAQNARRSDVYIQPDGRYVVRGPNSREHIISVKGATAKLSTSLSRNAKAHAGKVRNGERTPVTEEQYDDFMKPFKK